MDWNIKSTITFTALPSKRKQVYTKKQKSETNRRYLLYVIKQNMCIEKLIESIWMNIHNLIITVIACIF